MRVLYLIIGCIAMILGLIGIVLPVIPTTPFLILAAFCLSKSSRRFHDWFIATKLYQKHLNSFVSNRSMTLNTKIRLLVLASSMLIIAGIFMDNIYLRLFLLSLIIFKYYYFIFRIKTIPA